MDANTEMDNRKDELETGLNRKVGIIGSGLIGSAWTIIFTSYGYKVQMYDTNAECLSKVMGTIEKKLTDLAKANLLRGGASVEERMALISTTCSLKECIDGAIHIQECVFENLPLKQDLFGEIDELLGDDNTNASICSSTSVHLPSLVFKKVVRHKSQCLVAHPINPPMHVRLVELIPHPDTREDILIRTRLTMDEIGQKPVVLNKEVIGFALNRLQFAVLQEAFRLVHDGIMTPEDVDTVVSEGLGPRYAFMGPWMTIHLNATGVSEYMDKYGPGIYEVAKTFNPLLSMEGEAAQQIVDAMIREVPIEKLADKREWRDKCLIELAQTKDKLGSM